jgi:hypothetical protein
MDEVEDEVVESGVGDGDVLEVAAGEEELRV